jgi:serine phosphatase RsbU (regulator of sigma subunit)
LIATAADCTGHGVPGAFMSMLGISFLNELMAKPDNLHSDEILNLLRLQVISSLNPKGLHYETKDGMDIALVVYNYETNELEFSGANNPMYHIRDGELNEIKADKMPIGLHERCGELFQCHKIVPNPNDIIYLFSDGFPDQFGGEKGKKYMSKNFKEFLLGIHQKPIVEQEQLIADESLRWRGCIEQIDDQIVMGMRFL